MGSQDDNHLIYELYERTVYGEIDLDDIMVNATHEKWFQGVDPKNPFNIWIIYLDDSKITLDVITQTSVRYQEPKLIRNYGTNNWMLWYKHI